MMWLFICVRSHESNGTRLRGESNVTATGQTSENNFILLFHADSCVSTFLHFRLHTTHSSSRPRARVRLCICAPVAGVCVTVYFHFQKIHIYHYSRVSLNQNTSTALTERRGIKTNCIFKFFDKMCLHFDTVKLCDGTYATVSRSQWTVLESWSSCMLQSELVRKKNVSCWTESWSANDEKSA